MPRCITEKGSRRRTIGLDALAGQALHDYLDKAQLTCGPLFRPLSQPPEPEARPEADELPHRVPVASRLLRSVPPGALKEFEGDDSPIGKKCLYTPHSTRATTATLLLEAGEDIRKVQEPLGHRHVTTTQIYEQLRRQTSEGASHHVPI